MRKSFSSCQGLIGFYHLVYIRRYLHISAKFCTILKRRNCRMSDGYVLYTLEEVAKILRVSVATVRRMIDDGELEAIKVRGQWRVRKDILDRYLGKTQEWKD